jgi:hypothetical protein
LEPAWPECGDPCGTRQKAIFHRRCQ